MSLQFDVAPALAAVVGLAEVWFLERRKGPGVEFSGNRSAILTVSGDKFNVLVAGQVYDSDTISYFIITA